MVTEIKKASKEEEHRLHMENKMFKMVNHTQDSSRFNSLSHDHLVIYNTTNLTKPFEY